MILVTNSEIESKPGDIEYQYGYIEHMALLVLSKDNGAILSQTIIANNGESKSYMSFFLFFNGIMCIIVIVINLELYCTLY